LREIKQRDFEENLEADDISRTTGERRDFTGLFVHFPVVFKYILSRSLKKGDKRVEVGRIGKYQGYQCEDKGHESK
jgi:hypothetical protein